jgi:hypothetical protein
VKKKLASNNKSGYCKNCLDPKKYHVMKWGQERRDFKKKIVEMAGGKCIICGYSKSYKALEFHHKDPNEKDFIISEYNTNNFDNIIEEIKKCILVCSNCHREVHDNLIEESFIQSL